MNQNTILNELSDSSFEGINYLDLNWDKLSNNTGEIKILFSEQPKKSTAFVSADGTIHLYGSDPVFAVDHLLKNFDQQALRSASLFTTKPIMERLQAVDPSFRESFSFDYYNLKIKSRSSEHVEFDFLQIEKTEKSQVFLKHWYNTFNKEMDSSWIIPNIIVNTDYRFYVLKNRVGKIIGAVANTLPSKKRFWFGRFYIWPEFRGTGVSLVMLNKLSDLALGEGKDLSLLVQVDNKSAIELYRKYGFIRNSELRVLKAE